MKIDKDITFSVILVNYKDRTVSEIVRLSDETEADILCKKLNDALDCCEHEVRVEFSVRHNHSDLGKHFESRRRPGRMLKESSDGVVVFTGRFDNRWEIPLENLENADWDFYVDKDEDLMEQMFSARVKDVNNEELAVSVDVLVHPDDHLTYSCFYISDDDDHETDSCSINDADTTTESACDVFGIVPKSFKELRRIYNEQ